MEKVKELETKIFKSENTQAVRILKRRSKWSHLFNAIDQNKGHFDSFMEGREDLPPETDKII